MDAGSQWWGPRRAVGSPHTSSRGPPLFDVLSRDPPWGAKVARAVLWVLDLSIL